MVIDSKEHGNMEVDMDQDDLLYRKEYIQIIIIQQKL